MSRYAMPRAGDPLAWVFGVVLGALVLIGTISVVVRGSVDADSRRVSVEGVTLVGDATAVQVAAATRPAEAALRSMTALIRADVGAAESDARVLDELGSALEAQQAIAAVALAAADGSSHELARTAEGFVSTVVSPSGAVSVTWLDSTFEPVDPPVGRRTPPPMGAALWRDTDLSQPGIQWSDPMPAAEGRTTVTASMAVTVPREEPSAVVAVRLDTEMLARILEQSPAAEYGAVRLAGADGTVLAGDGDLTMPEGADAVDAGDGVVSVDDSLVSYERPVSDEIPWSLTVQIDGTEVLPAVAAVDRTMTYFTIAIITITAALAVVLWILRRPAGEVSLRARTDALTGLANRHHFEAVGTSLLYTARRRGHRVVIAIFDLDHFKSINDGAGHESGDAALAAVADGLRRGVGPRDLVARVGGDEFAAALFIRDDADAAQAVERVRLSAARALHDAVGDEFDVGVSAGWAEATGADHRLRYWVIAADEALVAGRGVAKGVTYESRRI